ncbi:MAG: DUF1015 family protein [Verrucomicrobiae bacterium]|nr:DUF1015 family protein [Verrucomicrobiae bacterium]
MANIRPFTAILPKPELASRICELPYDVVSTEEARKTARFNPYSFFRVSKPEIEFSTLVNTYSQEVYERGKANFLKMLENKWLFKDEKPNFYIYRLKWNTHIQTGIVALAGCQDYLNNVIKKHELTQPEKEDDRMRHIEIMNAQTGIVFLVYRANNEIDEFIESETNKPPFVDFVALDGVHHTSWIVNRPEKIQFLETQFSKINSIYIADGHHRAAAAVRIFRKRNGAGETSGFLSAIFADHQVKILPYNRVLLDTNGLTKENLLKELNKVFNISQTTSPVPDKKGVVCFYFDKRWLRLEFKPEIANSSDPVEQLDVSLLQRLALQPIFGIDDPRTNKRIVYVGGIRGTQELEKMVDSENGACAFSMYPTSIQDIMTISDAGKIMPPKSTWFEPKLRDAMFCHII